MLTETVVSALLEASITGAGLVFAIFALITPISRRTFSERAKKLRELVEDYNREKKKAKDSKRLNQLQREIKLTRIFPVFLNFGLLSAFFFFAATVFNCGAWLVNIGNRTSAFEPLISLNFFLALASFFLVGIATIFLISNMMRKELNT